MRLARFARPFSRVLTAGAMCLVGSAAWAQGTVTGRVTAQGSNQPLSDARVLALGTNAAANTDQDGRYTLRGVRSGTIEVQVLHVGYQPLKKTVTVTAGGTATTDFALTTAVVRLQDVVTTATGEQRKIELGHAVATLGDVSTRVEQTSITNMSDLLVAKVSGMVVIPGAFTNGAPMIRIRGLNSLSLNNSPIFVVDGVRMNVGGSSSNGFALRSVSTCRSRARIRASLHGLGICNSARRASSRSKAVWSSAEYLAASTSSTMPSAAPCAQIVRLASSSSFGIPCLQVLTQKTIVPGASLSGSHTWTRGPTGFPQLAPGNYQLRGVMLTTPTALRSVCRCASRFWDSKDRRDPQLPVPDPS